MIRPDPSVSGRISLLGTLMASPIRNAIYRSLIAASCVSFFACGVRAQLPKDDDLPADTLIVLQRGACEHRCAVYKVAIFADGTVIFDGQHYVRKTGLAQFSIGQAALKQLVGEAAQLGFYDLRNRYGYDDAGSECASILSDAPSVVVSVSSGGKSKTILHHLRCAGAETERLQSFEEKIDKAANIQRWIK
jgi:hypothetical protein